MRRPRTGEYEPNLEWICRTFGYLESRDKHHTAYSILKALVEAAVQDGGFSSEELAEKLSVTRGTVIHHLNRMMKNGLVIFHESKYKLRERSLRNTFEEVRRDLNRVFMNLSEVATIVDNTLSSKSLRNTRNQ